jgi:hypothetical protein
MRRARPANFKAATLAHHPRLARRKRASTVRHRRPFDRRRMSPCAPHHARAHTFIDVISASMPSREGTVSLGFTRARVYQTVLCFTS